MGVEGGIFLQPSACLKYVGSWRPQFLLQSQHLSHQVFRLSADLFLLIDCIQLLILDRTDLLFLLLIIFFSLSGCSSVLFQTGGANRGTNRGSICSCELGSICHKSISTWNICVIWQHACRLYTEGTRASLVFSVLFIVSKRVCSFSYLAIQVFFWCGFEWDLPSEHDKKKHTTGPDISRRPPIVFLIHDLWRRVTRCTAENPQFFPRDARKAEINYFHLMRPWIVHDIFRFEVSMTDVFWVGESQCLEHLVQNNSDCGLSH